MEDKFQTSQKSAQLLQKQIKDLEKRNKQTQSDLSDQIQHRKSVEKALSKEQDQKEQILHELQNYKIYLPEAESLLQEVNKRHQNSQKELDHLMEENTKLKTQYQSQLQSHQATIDRLKSAIEDEKRKQQEL